MKYIMPDFYKYSFFGLLRDITGKELEGEYSKVYDDIFLVLGTELINAGVPASIIDKEMTYFLPTKIKSFMGGRI